MTNDARTAFCNVVLVFPQTEFEQIIYLFEQIRHTYNIYAGSGGRGGECINYSTAENPRGPWTFRGQVTGAAENSFTIHPGVVDYKGHTYLFYHNGKLDRDGQKGQSLRRSVCVDELLNAIADKDPLANLQYGKKKRAAKVAGTRLIRIWKGKEYSVSVSPQGKYLYDGHAYKSLSAVARAITGTRWNGKLFFGVKS